MAVVFNKEEGVMAITGTVQHRRGAEAELMKSGYIPEAGEIVIATDTGRIKAGNGIHTWAQLPAYDETEIVNNLTTATAGKALDAVQGKALNDRLTVIEEGLTGINCGTIVAE